MGFLVKGLRIGQIKPSLCIQACLLMGTLYPHVSLFTSEFHHYKALLCAGFMNAVIQLDCIMWHMHWGALDANSLTSLSVHSVNSWLLRRAVFCLSIAHWSDDGYSDCTGTPWAFSIGEGLCFSRILLWSHQYVPAKRLVWFTILIFYVDLGNHERKD